MDVISDDDPTVPRCIYCGRIALKGGPIVPTEAAISYASGTVCSRGPGWSWCYYYSMYQLHKADKYDSYYDEVGDITLVDVAKVKGIKRWCFWLFGLAATFLFVLILYYKTVYGHR